MKCKSPNLKIHQALIYRLQKEYVDNAVTIAPLMGGQNLSLHKVTRIGADNS
ncbi:uncharacterized protein PHALS_07524 [Plasmopara halstedii]|uniref:Uncharacterized protein n=1 Tax=Plasmopara halstedii TaxID=4781 RepID=A0A0P1B6Q6_PLAHL|nr:uncharacterized protein PHALS_07524 [Plasmopara halstedii]CEG49778.1 hypothetical protein PHALS_07524 [Plasmopara halstedii]|eukprot:XP_024586147.1 hypothetical protein PHALS_07524 [Plasmopara halstedii]